MADLMRRSSLDGHLGHIRIPGVGAVSLEEVRPRAMAQILGAPPPAVLRGALSAFNLVGDPAPHHCSRGEGVRLLWTGPGQYLVVSWRHDEDALERSQSVALTQFGSAAVDLSHARTVLRLDGAAAIDVVAKGCPIDVDAMAVGGTAATMLSHLNVLLHREAVHAFEVYVARSFGQSSLDWLRHAGREFGLNEVVDR